MILTFKPQFVEPIKAGTKVHTIREDKKGRWKAGMSIHFWQGNPRNVHSKIAPYQFGAGTCKKVDDIKLDLLHNAITLVNKELNSFLMINDIIDLNMIAENDGFKNWDDMKQWFLNEYPDQSVFKGKLIHFEANTSVIVSDDQNTIICYGETYKAGILDEYTCVPGCDLYNKKECGQIPCASFERKDGKYGIIFKRVKPNEPR